MTIELALDRSLGLERVERTVPALLSFAVVAVTARAGGGFQPATWGWSALGPLVAAAVAAALLASVELGALDVALIGAAMLLVLWTGLSTIWSDSVSRSVSEVERDLVYVSVVAACLLLSRRLGAGALLHGLVAATTLVCGYGLATRLFPDHFGLRLGFDYRLAEPLGYSNAVGIVAAMGIVLALGATCSARNASWRAAASGATVVLAAALYFTFSRSAWLALLLALVVAFALEPARSRLACGTAAVALPVGVAVWLCSRSPGLTEKHATLAVATSDGHRLASMLVALVCAAAAVPVILERTRIPALPAGAPRVLAVLAAALVLGAVTAGIVAAGGPAQVWNRGSHAFGTSQWTADPKLNHRLLSISGHDRLTYWRVAWREAKTHPWLGSGAGTYELYWARNRPLDVGALDAHSLYLETLAELGPPGLLFLCLFLAMPLVALARARRRPGVATAGAAYAAFLVSAGADWHWELPTVTVVALCCGCALVVAARGTQSSHRVMPSARIAALAALGTAAAAAVLVQAGANALAASHAAADQGRYRDAAALARRAVHLAPWSTSAREALATAQLGAGEFAAARTTLRRAVAREPRDWKPWYELALASTGESRRRSLAEVHRLNPLVFADNGVSETTSRGGP